MGAQNVGYFEAWWYWWQGEDLKGWSLYGFPMIWLGRIAKIVSYAAGLTILLDLLGPDRVRELAGRMRRRTRPRNPGMAVAIAAIFWVPLSVIGSVIITVIGVAATGNPRFGKDSIVVAAAGQFVGVIFVIARVLPLMVAQVFIYERYTRSVRWIAFMIFSLAFSFDLLTS